MGTPRILFGLLGVLCGLAGTHAACQPSLARDYRTCISEVCISQCDFLLGCTTGCSCGGLACKSGTSAVFPGGAPFSSSISPSCVCDALCGSNACGVGTCYQKVADCHCAGYVADGRSCKVLTCPITDDMNHASPPQVVGPNGPTGVYIDSVDYDETAIFTCDTGYRIKPNIYSISRVCSCTSSNSCALSEPALQCVPVTCGASPSVLYATQTPPDASFLSYNKPITYSCDAGFTLDGKVDGATSFTLDCGPTGEIIGNQNAECLAIRCGLPPAIVPGSGVTTNKQEVLSYGQSATYHCPSGYSWDGLTPLSLSNTAKNIHCLVDGSFSDVSPGSCSQAYCSGAPATTTHAQLVDPSPVPVGGSALYQCNENTTSSSVGFAFPAGTTSFTIQCLATGQFDISSQVHDCFPVVCSPTLPADLSPLALPSTPFPTPSKPLVTQTAIFTCPANYTTTSVGTDFGGVQDIPITCPWSGILTAAAGTSTQCLPVSCSLAQLNAVSLYIQIPIDTINSAASVNSLTPGFRVECAPGFDPASFYLRCLPTGRIDTAPVFSHCLISSCAIPPLSNIATPLPSQLSSGTSIVADCRPNTSTDGLARVATNSRFTMTCTVGVLEGASHCIPIPCPIVPNNLLTATPAQSFGYVAGDSYTYTCAPNAALLNGLPNTITCLQDAQWSLPSGSCVASACGAIPNATHASTTTTTVPGIGSTVSYTCDTGYTLNGFSYGSAASAILCTSTGSYSPPTPRDCFPISCGAPPSLNNASPMNTTLPATLTYADGPLTYVCAHGYVSSLLASSTVSVSCLATGLFSSDHCEPISCPAAPSQPFSIFSPSTQVSLGASVTYFCLPGYNTPSSMAQFTVTCQVSGTYTNASVCEPVVCGPAPLFAFANNHTIVNSVSGEPIAVTPTTPVVFGQSVLYTCAPGYTLYGTTYSLVCSDSGMFTQSAVACAPVSCGLSVPDVAHTHVEVGRSEPYTFGEHGVLVCDQGYSQVSGNGSFVCSVSGAFIMENPLSCIASVCTTPPNTENATTTAPGALVGVLSTIEFTCRPGLVGSYSYRCLAQDTLSAPQPDPTSTCRPCVCSASEPEISHATLNTAASGTPLEFGATPLEYTCNAGYVLTAAPQSNSSAPTTLTAGCDSACQVVHSGVCLPISCGVAPVASHATRTGLTAVTFTAQAVYVCDTGYETATGTDFFSVVCQADGTFSSPSHPGGCQAVSCAPEPPAMALADGPVCSSSSLTFGTTCEYQCQAGVSSGGAFNRTCTASGEWNNAVAQCSLSACPFAPAYANALVNCTGASHGDTCKYTCEPGFVANALTLQCVTSAWSPANAPFECVPISCGLPPTVVNAQLLLTTNITFGQQAHYTCDSGYDDSSALTAFSLACLASGSFASVPTPACLPVSCGVPPSVPLSSRSTTVSRVFGDPPVVYTCNTGHGLRSNSSLSTFTRSCQASGSFSPALDCTVRLCPLSDVSHATSAAASDSLQYPESTSFTCDTGYTTNGIVGGSNFFLAQCLADGSLSLASSASCKPISCGSSAPPISNSVHSPAGVFISLGDIITYTCDTGFSPPSFQRVCTATGTLDNPSQQCLRVSCGRPPVLPEANTTSAYTAAFFADSITYTCNAGYSLTGTAQGATSFQLDCASSGSFNTTNLPSCVRVLCGLVPVKADATASLSLTDQLFFGDAVTYSCHSGFAVAPTNEQSFSVSCLASGQLSNGAAACTNVSCADALNITLGGGALVNPLDSTLVYPNAREYRCPEGHSISGAASGAQSLYLSCGADGVARVLPSSSARCQPIACDTTLAAQLTGDPFSSTISSLVFGDAPVAFTCAGVVGHEGGGAVECLANGTLSVTPANGKCVPVTCPALPTPAHSVAPIAPVLATPFPVEVAFVCESGYVGGGVSTCNANRTWTVSGACIARSCGVLPTVLHASANISSSSSVFFGQAAIEYSCDAGYTTTAVGGTTNSSPTRAIVTCESTGTFSTLPTCYRVACNGTLLPTVTHGIAPFMSGDSNLVNEGTTITYNCLSGYTRLGATVTLVCDAATGTFVAANSTSSSATACEAIVCDAGDGVSLAFGASPLVRTCPTGHSLSGTFGGPTTYEQRCELSGVMTAPPACLPVACDGSSLVFNETASLPCATNTTLDGVAGSSRAREQRCLADGTLSPLPQCLPISCGIASSSGLAHANLENAVSLVVGEEAMYVCDAGFDAVLTATGAVAGTTLTQECLVTGLFSSLKGTCERRVCPAVPSVANATLIAATGPTDGTARYNDTFTFQCALGFTPTTLQVTCTPSGALSTIECAPVACGLPPPINFAQSRVSTTTSVHYPQLIGYDCLENRTLDSFASGPRSFDIACLTSGEFSALPECQRIQCGTAPVPSVHDNAVAFSTTTIVYVGEEALYECNPDYVILATNATSFHMTCLASGEFEYGGNITLAGWCELRDGAGVSPTGKASPPTSSGSASSSSTAVGAAVAVSLCVVVLVVVLVVFLRRRARRKEEWRREKNPVLLATGRSSISSGHEMIPLSELSDRETADELLRQNGHMTAGGAAISAATAGGGGGGGARQTGLMPSAQTGGVALRTNSGVLAYGGSLLYNNALATKPSASSGADDVVGGKSDPLKIEPLYDYSDPMSHVQAKEEPVVTIDSQSVTEMELEAYTQCSYVTAASIRKEAFSPRNQYRRANPYLEYDDTATKQQKAAAAAAAESAAETAAESASAVTLKRQPIDVDLVREPGDDYKTYDNFRRAYGAQTRMRTMYATIHNKQKEKRPANPFAANGTSQETYSELLSAGESNGISVALTPEHQSLMASLVFAGLQLARHRISAEMEIGRGQFGVVFSGKLSGVGDVAIKMLTMQGGSSESELRGELLREAKFMAPLKHSNVVRLMGVCVPEEPWLIVTEYCAFGDLRTFMRAMATAVGLTENVSVAERMRMAMQVADGMAYLVSLNVVHRDLAARNCLVANDSTVKVSDFGMSRLTTQQNEDGEDIYRMRTVQRVPVRWMAPESLDYRVYGERSDVWSYGVLYWELATWGTLRPYSGIELRRIPSYLRQGKRLSRPELSTAEEYELMLATWDKNPAARPSFAELASALRRLIPQRVALGDLDRELTRVLEECSSSSV